MLRGWGRLASLSWWKWAEDDLKELAIHKCRVASKMRHEVLCIIWWCRRATTTREVQERLIYKEGITTLNQVTQTICEVAITRELHNLAEQRRGWPDPVASYFDCDFSVQPPQVPPTHHFNVSYECNESITCPAEELCMIQENTLEFNISNTTTFSAWNSWHQMSNSSW